MGSEENVRPIFWANRPKSYLSRTNSWDDYPNGRWGDSRSAAFGECGDEYHMRNGSRDAAKETWGVELTSENDVYKQFVSFLRGELRSLPFCENTSPETGPISSRLCDLNSSGILTINSQPQVNGAPSNDPAFGWGGPGGYVYQKAYIEFFCPPTVFAALEKAFQNHPSISWCCVSASGGLRANNDKKVNAVTWGVFPDREVLQPTIVDKESFLVWKDEAYSLWLDMWRDLYEVGSESYKIIQNIHDTYYLVNIVENDFVNGDIFRLLDEALATAST